jgi:hypothetical protein
MNCPPHDSDPPVAFSLPEGDAITEFVFLLPGQDLVELEKMAFQRQMTTSALLRTLISSFLEWERRQPGRSG